MAARPSDGVKPPIQPFDEHGEKLPLTILKIYPEMDRLLAGVLIRPKVLRRRVEFGDESWPRNWRRSRK
jgi:hypothetical protein